mgnify:CR=1 FL=1
MKAKAVLTLLVLFLVVFAGCQPPTKLAEPPKKQKSKISKKEQAPKPKKQKTETPAPTQSTKANVSRVVDGDTFVIATGQRVRLIGIDTPEVNQPYYFEAKQKLTSLIANKDVEMEKDVSETDKYGRLLRYVYVDALFVNAELVKEGYARVFTYPPDVKYAQLFVNLEREARANNRGLWAQGSKPAPPPQPHAPVPQGQLIGNKSSHKLHNLAHADCQYYVSLMNPANKVSFSSLAEAQQQGYQLCLKCP